MVVLVNDTACSHITHKFGAGQNKEIRDEKGLFYNGNVSDVIHTI